MFVQVIITTIFIDRSSITPAGDIYFLSSAHIFQITFPAACGLNLEYEAIIIQIVEASACHNEVGGRRAFIQREIVACACVVSRKIQRTTIGTACMCRGNPIPLKVFGQIVDLCLNCR